MMEIEFENIDFWEFLDSIVLNLWFFTINKYNKEIELYRILFIYEIVCITRMRKSKKRIKKIVSRKKNFDASICHRL